MDHGRYLEGLPEYKGKTVFEANPIIVALLRDRGALLGEQKLSHSYPHCWRCHNPVIFRATEQWFIDLDGAGSGCGRDPATRACGNRQSEMDSRVGRAANPLDDRGAARLVRLAAAILGRAAGDPVLQRNATSSLTITRRCTR
jgi:valyl-tRNA synthetase